MCCRPYRVTIGTSSGFGKRLMLSILARGDRVIASARSLEKLETMISSSSIQDRNRLRTLHLDVSEGEEKIKAQIDLAVTFWGQIDVLVNNAGIGLASLVEEGGSKILRKQFETNVFGVLDVRLQSSLP
ncbi:hypothetical protein CPB84DRAFT_1021569 [Gymnopilus junonius]|uniref:Uncharacterized protein n=1 Tax=Gymnopilus junonius TaxID=109634 RepID=A0A9P5NQQ5_GYMJU|nr:hypothetical protein CPB84DRAFT_1021569 [Gymnopilus junonius]